MSVIGAVMISSPGLGIEGADGDVDRCRAGRRGHGVRHAVGERELAFERRHHVPVDATQVLRHQRFPDQLELWDTEGCAAARGRGDQLPADGIERRLST